jgi:hypothetical protein
MNRNISRDYYFHDRPITDMVSRLSRRCSSQAHFTIDRSASWGGAMGDLSNDVLELWRYLRYVQWT